MVGKTKGAQVELKCSRNSPGYSLRIETFLLDNIFPVMSDPITMASRNVAHSFRRWLDTTTHDRERGF
jgi:hypothetical protein